MTKPEIKHNRYIKTYDSIVDLCEYNKVIKLDDGYILCFNKHHLSNKKRPVDVCYMSIPPSNQLKISSNLEDMCDCYEAIGFITSFTGIRLDEFTGDNYSHYDIYGMRLTFEGRKPVLRAFCKYNRDKSVLELLKIGE